MYGRAWEVAAPGVCGCRLSSRVTGARLPLVLLALSLAAPATASDIAPPETVKLKIRGPLVEWQSRYRYAPVTHLMIRIDGRVATEEPFSVDGTRCGAYYYLRGVSARLDTCYKPGHGSPLRVRARSSGKRTHTVTIRFAGRRVKH